MDVREFKVLQWIKYMVWREGPNWKHRFIRNEIERCGTVMNNIYAINILPDRMR
jgi:hypothetical protein